MTVILDEYKEADTVSNTTCSQCGSDGGCLTLWTEHDTTQSPDESLCIRCLFKTEGRYKHQPPEYLLKQFETVDVIDETDDAIIVHTQSDLGAVHYWHYIESSIQTVTSEADQRRQFVQFREARELTSAAEAFTESGDFLTDSSPYHEVAIEHLTPR